ncbi:hypothetical protein GCM10010466_29470 [Planomonospora alba]|uniref:Uncharacterized protein n=1 Tax=Planomonospora alba TaxID=161354 RepID=A0ABP6N5L9_9ACTN
MTTVQHPYVIAYAGEAEIQHVLFRRVRGEWRLTHAEPRRDDWGYGILRARSGASRQGKPLFDVVNPRRQWTCADCGLCQVCGETARDPETGRYWWLLSDEGESEDRGWTNAPPTCRACIPAAVTQCPHLRRGRPAVYTAGAFEPYGVFAVIYSRSGQLAYPLAEKEIVTFGDPRASHALATQLLVCLRDLRLEPLEVV